MKSVILIGDSIRMGYQPIVQRELDGLAEVWGSAENGGNSQNVLEHLEVWALSRDLDIVHVNCGLHDIKTPFDSDARAIPLAEYRANVRTILSRLQTETQAVVIWATTTPVNHERHHQNKDFDRFEADVDAYNAAATTIATELGIPVNDLFSVVMRAGRDEHLVPDGVHYTGPGYERLAAAVTTCIKQHL